MKEFLKNLKFIWKYSKSEKKRIILYFIFSVFNIVTSIIYPFISAKIIANLTDNNIEQFIYMGAVLLSAYLIDNTIMYFKSKVYRKCLENTYANIQSSLGYEILKLTNKTLEENGTGVFIQRLIVDTQNVSTIFTDLNNYINGIILNIGVLVTYFVLSKAMFAFVLIAFGVRLFIEISRSNAYTKNNKKYKKCNDEMTSILLYDDFDNWFINYEWKDDNCCWVSYI